MAKQLEDGQLRFAIWKNDNKDKETSPDYKGTAEDNKGNQYWVSSWRAREDANPNAPVLSGYLNLKPKENAAPAKKEESEDIPF